MILWFLWKNIPPYPTLQMHNLYKCTCTKDLLSYCLKTTAFLCFTTSTWLTACQAGLQEINVFYSAHAQTLHQIRYNMVDLGCYKHMQNSLDRKRSLVGKTLIFRDACGISSIVVVLVFQIMYRGYTAHELSLTFTFPTRHPNVICQHGPNYFPENRVLHVPDALGRENYNVQFHSVKRYRPQLRLGMT